MTTKLDLFRLDGRVALVTDADGGPRRVLAQALAAKAVGEQSVAAMVAGQPGRPRPAWTVEPASASIPVPHLRRIQHLYESEGDDS